MIFLVKKKKIKKIPYGKEMLFSEVFPEYGIFWYDKIETELRLLYTKWVKLSDTCPITITRIKKTFFEKMLDKFRKVIL